MLTFAVGLTVAAGAATGFGLHTVHVGRSAQLSVHDEPNAGFDEPESEAWVPEILSQEELMRRQLADWKRPEGPLKVALQAGHWKAAEAPEELKRLRQNGTAAAGHSEWSVNLAIAEKTAEMLRERGYEVEVLPTTIPPDYYADAFVAIHADGNPDTDVSGYKASGPRRDFSGKGRQLSDLLDAHYAEATGLPYDPNVTRNMLGYYAFNWRRYEHSLHPMTPAAILETGFLTNASDRRIIVSNQEVAARGVADAVTAFLGPAMQVQYSQR